jgi:hypothetical protein
VAQASIAADIDQALDVHGHFPAKVPFYMVLPVDGLPQAGDFVFRQIPNPCIRVDVGFGQDLIGPAPSNAVNISQGDFYSLVPRQVHPCYSCQVLSLLSSALALSLLVFRVLANHPHTAFALNDLALFADRLH